MKGSSDAALRDITLGGALDRVRDELRMVLMVMIGVSTLLIFSQFIFAFTRSQMHGVAMPAHSDHDVVVFLGVAVFWIVAMTCMGHLCHWLACTVGFRAGHLLSAPAVVASATAGRGVQATKQAVADVDHVVDGLSGHLLPSAVLILLIPIPILLLLSLHWAFALLAAVGIGSRLLLEYFGERMLRPLLHQANRRHADVMGAMAGALNAAEAIEAMGMVPNLARRWGATMSADAVDMDRLQRRLLWVDGASSFLNVVIQPAPLVLMAALTLAGVDIGRTAGIGAHLVVHAALVPFHGIIDRLILWTDLRMAWDRLRNLARRQKEMKREAGVFLCAQGKLEVEKLTVMLPGMGQPIIREMTFRLMPGQVLSLVGPVGCGKSTLLRSIMGIQPPTAGACYLDGHSTMHWDALDLARHIGYLPQDVGMSSGTVADMIARLGPPDMEEVLLAAQRAGAHELIVGLPRGYSTRLTEHSLSAGQRQRLALARAVYGRPRLLVMDEPGAWLDAEGLATLRQLIATMKREGCSVVFSTHEQSLLRQADHGIVLGPIGSAPRVAGRPRIQAPTPAVAELPA